MTKRLPSEASGFKLRSPEVEVHTDEYLHFGATLKGGLMDDSNLKTWRSPGATWIARGPLTDRPGKLRREA